MRVLFVAVLCGSLVTQAGTRDLGNDGFTGSGNVNSAVAFGEYEGAAVLITPDGGYPLKVVGVDVLLVQYNQGTGAALGAYQLDVWDEGQGPVDPPRLFDGGQYTARATEFVQLTASTTMFNRITLTQPMMVQSGRVFISLGEQLSTADDGTTVGLDSSPLVPEANWYRETTGIFTRLDQPDGGFYRGIDHNWVMRLVVDDGSGTGGGGGTGGGTGTGGGFATGGGSGTGGGFATGGGSATGGGTSATGGSSGTGGAGSTGGGAASGTLRLDSVTPPEGFNEETTTIVLTGAGFQAGAQVLIGSTLLAVVDVKSPDVIDADVPPGIPQGVYDVTVINLDGMKATLPMAFTVNQGVSTKGGCGCGSTGAGPALLLLSLGFGLRRRRRA
jgi:MYXO-CTERM domain-containing protein